MPLPGDINVITITGTYLDPFGNPQAGQVVFYLTVPLQDSTGHVILAGGQYPAVLNAAGQFSITLPCTDNASVSPLNQPWIVAEQVAGVNRVNNFLLPHSLGASVDISTLVPVNPAPGTSTVYGVLAQANAWTAANTFTGPVVVPTPTASGQAATKAYVDGHGGGGTPPTVRQAYFTTGNVTFGSDASWKLYTAIELDIPAAVGDWVELVMSGMWQQGSGDFIDWAVVVGTTAVRYSSTGTGTPAVQGDPSFYPGAGFIRGAGLFGFQVTSGDLDGANVRFTVAHIGTPGGGTLYSSTSYPLRLRALNLHTVT